MLKIVDSEKSKIDALTIAKQIFDQFAKVKTVSKDDDDEEEVANTEEIDDEDDIDTHAAEVEEEEDDHIGQDNAGEAVESLPNKGEAQDQLDSKDHDDVDMNVREDAGSHLSAEKGDLNVDTSATEDDLPQKKDCPFCSRMC